jgi:hypothetical protein
MNSLIADVMAVCMMVVSLLLLFLLLHVVAVITVFMIMIMMMRMTMTMMMLMMMMTMTMTMTVVPMLGDNAGDESIARLVFGKEAPGIKPTSLGCFTNMLVWQARTHMP